MTEFPEGWVGVGQRWASCVIVDTVNGERLKVLEVNAWRSMKGSTHPTENRFVDVPCTVDAFPAIGSLLPIEHGLW